MYKFKTMRPLIQAMGIITAVMVLVTGVTYAALQSQQDTLRGNTIQTAIANLKLSTDNVTYATSLNGYSFGGLIPGGAAAPANGYPVYVRNDGSTALAIKLSVEPAITNPNNVDLTKVHVILSPMGAGAAQNILLSDLMTANLTGGLPITISGYNHVSAAANNGLTLQILMDGDAVSAASASIGNLTFDFDATAVN
jgi:hypothetical protein